MKLPLFPLKSIFFPGETVPLHIFEERYKQLIQDCRDEAITFGIPVYMNGTIAYGTEVQLVEVVNTYESGEFDVICVARQIFRILTFDHEMEGKLYAGGIVEFIDSVNDADDDLRNKVLDKLKVLYDFMQVQFPPTDIKKFNSYAFAHKMGLTFEQEYQLLQLTKESERLHYIQEHLDTTIAVLEQIDRTKAMIEMNGHFRNFDPLDFNDFEVK
ncbi:LON peptidase substrate-binding domain-containing protein [Allomuricauda sp. d1]|uniref:LON peptidase substrate-binding domain-containing protein n=1 Tax=Allomuricauda sp. d1 TaxID=3136725 RepID=UPI0031DFD643